MQWLISMEFKIKQNNLLNNGTSVKTNQKHTLVQTNMLTIHTKQTKKKYQKKNIK